MENMSAAKSFFATLGVEEVQTDFATTRKEAEVLLNQNHYVGIITDRSFPYEEDETEADYAESRGDDLRSKMSINGHSIITQATDRGIPWVMVSSHGNDTLFFYPQVKMKSMMNDREVKRRLAFYHQHKHEDFRKIGLDVMMLNMITEHTFCDKELGLTMQENHAHLPKTEKKCWQTAWQRLQRQL